MTTLIRGAELPTLNLLGGALMDLAEAKPMTLSGLDLLPTRASDVNAVVDLDQFDKSNTLCELELTDGMCVLLRPCDLKTSAYFQFATTRGDVELVPRRGRSRGSGDAMVRLLKLFKVDPIQLAGNFARDRVIGYVERNVRSGLFQLGSGPSELQELRSSTFVSSKPCLLMLHGTLSSTMGSFGDLPVANGGAVWRHLSDYFGPRMLALEHRTLSKSPIENAIELLQALPNGLHLHLISHSRGGLIGELLCRRDAQRPGFSKRELAQLEELEPALAAKARELDQLLRDKALVVDRFVRVACPARGTSLLSGRGQKWLTVLVNAAVKLAKISSDAALGAVGAAGLIPVARQGLELLQALTLEITEVEKIPGLNAMAPASNFIRGLINSEHAQAADGLAVIAGDTEGSGVLGRLKMFAVDTFFQNDNDLVVDTESMIGGAKREQTYRLLARGDDINHFRYFRGARTAGAIGQALTATELSRVDVLERFTIDQRALRAALRRPPLRQGRSDLPIVFLLPGIMGTELTADGDAIWVDHWALVRGGFGRLTAEAAGIVPGSIDGDTYQALADALAVDHEVIPFGYDWRLPIDDAARRLNDAVRARLADAERQKRSIRFVAHSMGGLVVRAMMTLKGSAWADLQRLPDRRFVMLGTPNQGSHAISLLLTGNDRLINMLAIADLRNSLHELVAIAAKFPGALDMTPATGERDYFKRQAWSDLASAKENPERWPLPEQSALDRSRDFRRRLDEQELSGDEVFYVAGTAKDTPIRADLDVSGARPRLMFIATREGDGRVPWATGIPAGIKAWYVPAKHGRIPTYRPLYAGLRDILASGATTRLSDAPPISRDSRGGEFEYPEQRINMVPIEGDLIEAALDGGLERMAIDDEPLPQIDVAVVWGNLRYAKHPVVVGHYAGDIITSAEAVLDTYLDHALSRRLDLGRYPGEVGTALVIPNSRGELPGAVVIGLGQVSTRLSRRDLARAVQTGVSEWAARILESKSSASQHASAEATTHALVFLAVGSGHGGMALTEVGSAILEGVHESLALLRTQRSIDEVKRLALTRVEFLELYEDRAHTLWHGLSTHAADGRLPSCMCLADRRKGVIAGEGGRRRLVLSEPDDWWNPLKITRQGSRLQFENIADRARAELHGVGTHASQIDDLLGEAVAHGDSDRSLCRVLFAMMIPNDLKDSLPSGNRLRLLVDGDTARYPWELIFAGQDRLQGDRLGFENQVGDWASEQVGNGVVRQFVTARFRPNPRMARSATALVIGDPKTGGVFAPLPGALQEAQAVHATLTELGFKLPSLVLRDARTILKQLHACSYQILHLAGHGIEDLNAWLIAECAALSAKLDNHNNAGLQRRLDSARLTQLKSARDELASTENPISAMVIGPQQFLTYRNIEQMSEVPELVFINCCHLGHIPAVDDAPLGRPGATAAAFAQKFIEIGVRAVVAAGWPVDDSAASTFADAFYRALRRGQSFGEAVRVARSETRRSHPNDNTWAAYQCYGDPSFRPTAVDRQSTGWHNEQERYGSPRHLAWEGIQTAGSSESLGARVALAIENGYDSDGELCCEIADAYRNRHDFKQAIDWYSKAMKAENATMPLRGIERLLNTVVRFGQVTWKSGQAPTSAWLRSIDEVIGLLDQINQYGPTQERYALIGSAQKRKAIALSGPKRIKALKAAAEAYTKAAELVPTSTTPYPFINAAVMHGAVARSEGKKLPDLEINGLLKRAADRVASLSGSEFWDFAAPGDLLMARIFVCDLEPLESNTRRALEYFEIAFERDRKKGNLASVLDQLRAMKSFVQNASKGHKYKNSAKLLTELTGMESKLSALLA